VHFCGKIQDEKYFEEIEIFRDFLKLEASDPEKEHIQQFLEAWPEN
jgi:hypothetical protein